MMNHSHVVLDLNLETGDISIDDDTLEANFPDGDFFDSKSNQWEEYKNMVDSCEPADIEAIARDKELREKIEQSLEAYNLLEEVFNEISVGDGEMSYEMYQKVLKFFDVEISEEEGER